MLKRIMRIIALAVFVVGFQTGAILLFGAEPTTPVTVPRLLRAWAFYLAGTFVYYWWLARRSRRRGDVAEEGWRATAPPWLRIAEPWADAFYMATFLVAYVYATDGELPLLWANVLALGGSVPMIVHNLLTERYEPAHEPRIAA